MQIFNFSRYPNLFSRLGVALLVAAITTVGFVAVMDEVLDGDTLAYDEAILLWIYSLSTPWLDSLMVWLTYLGAEGVVIATVLGVLVLMLRNQRYRAVFLLAAVAGAAILNMISKLVFERQRPDLWEQLVTEATFSFPSGHAMASCSLAVAVVILSWRSRWRYLIWSLMALYTITIGFTRLYLGVHYPTDVIGGWLLAITWVALVAGVMFRRSKNSESAKLHKPKL